jgi:diaminohydroxyphosphoribosylaminopyrimidine deaminase/5-amino-6-(5-phosphoribosylamino)uracil reductase
MSSCFLYGHDGKLNSFTFAGYMEAGFYMQHCLELASRGSGHTAPNPMVGAVLVYEDRIIGEGWHRQYGQAHAEVNCIASVKENDTHLIPLSTLYVTLEPCAHTGKTPPCADLIIRHKIPKVAIGCRDPFPEVDGKGIERLKAAGVEVIVGVLERECRELNKRFFTFHTKHRPYIILKWAETQDGRISAGNGQRLLISNEYSNRLVHQWRSEEAAILVGTNTALLDDPSLTTRLWPGPSPVRLVIDMELRLPSSLQLFNGEVRTIVFNTRKHQEEGNLLYYQLTHDTSIVHQVLNALYQLQLISVLVEGGAQLLQSFIDEGLWDEARVISNKKTDKPREITGKGLPAPRLTNSIKTGEINILTDQLNIYSFAG